MGIQERKKQRGEIILPNTSGTPGILVKDPTVAGKALDDALEVFTETYSMNGAGPKHPLSVSLAERVNDVKQRLILAQEGSLSQEERRKARQDAINFLRNASDLHAENQEKSNGNGVNGKVVFDSSQLQGS